MDNEKEKWMEEVFQSMKGSRRAKPSPELFSKIEDRIAIANAKFVSINQWKYAAVAAALILIVNATALLYYSRQSNKNTAVIADTYSQPIISTYQIYE